MSRYPDSLQPDIATTSGSGCSLIEQLCRWLCNIYVSQIYLESLPIFTKFTKQMWRFLQFRCLFQKGLFSLRRWRRLKSARLCVGKCSVFRGYNTEPWHQLAGHKSGNFSGCQTGNFSKDPIYGGTNLVPDFWPYFVGIFPEI